MPQIRSSDSAIRSSLAGDPLLGDMVRQFVADMPARIAWIERQLEAGDWEALKRAAHQMKGAAGSYGFEELTPFAWSLELLITRGATQPEIVAATGELVANCRRITADAPA
jgi:HPt (histidine-containing phosphotransfer) domain-containing protein